MHVPRGKQQEESTIKQKMKKSKPCSWGHSITDVSKEEIISLILGLGTAFCHPQLRRSLKGEVLLRQSEGWEAV